MLLTYSLISEIRHRIDCNIYKDLNLNNSMLLNSSFLITYGSTFYRLKTTIVFVLNMHLLRNPYNISYGIPNELENLLHQQLKFYLNVTEMRHNYRRLPIINSISLTNHMVKFVSSLNTDAFIYSRMHNDITQIKILSCVCHKK